MKVPFSFLPPSKTRAVAHHYLGWGEWLARIFPFIEWELHQADFEFEAREWLSVAFHTFLVHFSFMFSLMFLVLLGGGIELVRALLISLLIGFGEGFFVLVYLVFYPRLFVRRKTKDLERNLPTSLHHLLIEVRAGVPLFNSIVSVAKSDYGVLSQEFSKAVTEINTGKSEIAALEMLARNNPSLHFRRVLWQIVNALKSGADIGETLKTIVDAAVADQRVAIKRYGSQLNPLALFYMLFFVIFPTLGVVFMLMIFTFIGSFAFSLEYLLIGVLAYLVLFQFMFMGMIKTKRPTGI
jgi:flagellar protein FlaJ